MPSNTPGIPLEVLLMMHPEAPVVLVCFMLSVIVALSRGKPTYWVLSIAFAFSLARLCGIFILRSRGDDFSAEYWFISSRYFDTIAYVLFAVFLSLPLWRGRPHV
jgi:hypothetical protein